MKKIIIVFVALFCCFYLNNKAYAMTDASKPLIVGLNTDISDYLNIENYEIISNNVDTSREGTYYIEYMNDDEIVKKEVIVKSLDKLSTKGIQKITKEGQIKNDKVFVTALEIDNYLYLSEINKDNNECYVEIYQDYQKEKEILIASKRYCKIKFLSEYEDYIYGVGEIETKEQGVNLFVIKMTKTGEIIWQKSYGGSSLEYLTSMKIKDNYLYLCGYTTSNDYDLLHNVEKEDGFLLKINLNSTIIESYINLGESGIDTILDIAVGDVIYCFKRYFEDGICYTKIIVIDNQGVANEIVLPYYRPTKIIKSIFYKDNLYFIINVYEDIYNDMVSYLFKLDSQNNLELIDEYYNFNVETVDFIIKNDVTLILYRTLFQNEILMHGCKVRAIADKQNIVELNLSTRDVIEKVGFTNNSELIYIDKGNLIEFNSIMYLIIKNIGESELSSENQFVDPVVYANFNRLFPSKESSINPDLNLFGDYKIKSFFESENFDLAYDFNTRVKFECSVEDNNIYDIKIKLAFNGNATLNNEEIASGYQIDDPGTYELVVKGNDDEYKTVIFKVESLSNDLRKFSDITPAIEKISTKSCLSTSVVCNQKYGSSIVEGSKYENDLWLIMIPLSVSIVGIIIYILIKKKYEKNIL